jgi:hypothetical protein
VWNNRRFIQDVGGVPSAQTITDAQDMAEDVHSIVHDIGDGTGPLESSSDAPAVHFSTVMIGL